MPCKYQTIFIEANPNILQPINCNKAAVKLMIQHQLKNLTREQGEKKREVKKSMHTLKAL